MKTFYQVEPSDLKGVIKFFPIEVVQKMVEEQVRQGNYADVSVFQNDRMADCEHGGFDYRNTEYGYDFWYDIIANEKFSVFFEKYPKTPKRFYIKGNETRGFELIKTLEKYGGVNVNGYCGDNQSALYFINPTTSAIELFEYYEDNVAITQVFEKTYTEIPIEDFIVRLTMKEVAEKFGISEHATIIITK